MLSATADYALRAVLYLARSGSDPLKADAIARGIGAPPNYLAKTLNLLARAGIVRSTRGPLGGFVLALPADQLSLERVVAVFDESLANPRCLLHDRPCDPATPCSAHVHWLRVARAGRETLATTSVAQLAELVA